MFGGKNKGNDKGAKDAPAVSNVGPLKNASDELNVKDIKVYTDAKSSELIKVVSTEKYKAVKPGTELMIARVHVERLVKAGLVEEL